MARVKSESSTHSGMPTRKTPATTPTTDINSSGKDEGGRPQNKTGETQYRVYHQGHTMGDTRRAHGVEGHQPAPEASGPANAQNYGPVGRGDDKSITLRASCEGARLRIVVTNNPGPRHADARREYGDGDAYDPEQCGSSSPERNVPWNCVPELFHVKMPSTGMSPFGPSGSSIIRPLKVSPLGHVRRLASLIVTGIERARTRGSAHTPRHRTAPAPPAPQLSSSSALPASGVAVSTIMSTCHLCHTAAAAGAVSVGPGSMSGSQAQGWAVLRACVSHYLGW